MAMPGRDESNQENLAGRQGETSATAAQPKKKSTRGFASMSPERQREIARKGGKAAHEKGTAHEFTPEEARVAGRKGGEAVSRDRKHMAEIGREGGQARGLRATQRRRQQAEGGVPATGAEGGSSLGNQGGMSARPAGEAGGYSNVTRADFGGQTSHDDRPEGGGDMTRDTGT